MVVGESADSRLGRFCSVDLGVPSPLSAADWRRPVRVIPAPSEFGDEVYP